MSDLIKRQDAIDALGERPLAWTQDEYFMGLQNQYDSDLEAIQSVSPAQQWTPCSERLPDEDGDYLVLYDVYFINGDFAQRSVKVDQFFKELNAFCERFGEEEYIAWMPLPEFPRRSKDDID